MPKKVYRTRGAALAGACCFSVDMPGCSSAHWQGARWAKRRGHPGAGGRTRHTCMGFGWCCCARGVGHSGLGSAKSMQRDNGRRQGGIRAGHARDRPARRTRRWCGPTAAGRLCLALAQAPAAPSPRLRAPHRPVSTARRYIVVTNPHIKKVYNQYYVSFGEPRSWAGGQAEHTKNTHGRSVTDGRGLT